MFEVALEGGDLFRKIISAISDLVTDGNFQVDTNHISFQGMDSSHVSLVSLSLNKEGFTEYRCDRDLTLGINFGSLNKVLKCMGNNDRLMLKAQDDGDTIFIGFENENSKRLSNFELKLMEIDQEQLGIPDTSYSINVELPSQLFSKIIKDLSALGDSVTINVSKLGIKFTVNGDIGKGEVHLNGNVKKIKKQQNNNNSQNDDDTDMKEIKPENKNDNDNNNNNINADGDDDNKDDKKNNNENINNNDDDYNNDDDVDAVDDDDDDKDNEKVLIRMTDDCQQTFAIKYLSNFTKGTSLSKRVLLSMDNEVPLMCTYKINDLGTLRYYLAPKIDDDE